MLNVPVTAAPSFTVADHAPDAKARDNVMSRSSEYVKSEPLSVNQERRVLFPAPVRPSPPLKIVPVSYTHLTLPTILLV